MNIKLALILLAGAALAHPEFKVSDNVNEYHKHRGDRHYRSGLSKEAKDSLDTEAKPDYKLSVFNTIPYLEVNDSSKRENQVLQAVEEHLERAGFKVTEFGSKILAESKTTKVGGILVQIDADNPESSAMSVAKAVLPRKILKQIDLANVSKDFVQSLGGNTSVSKYIFRFYRVVDDRVVRSMDNYVSIEVPVNANVSKVEVAWQDLRKSKKSVSASNAEQVSMDNLQTILQTDYSTATKGTGLEAKQFNTESFEVKSAADAWCTLKLDGKKMLVPCESYTVQLTDKSGEAIHVLVDAPISGKY